MWNCVWWWGINMHLSLKGKRKSTKGEEESQRGRWVSVIQLTAVQDLKVHLLRGERRFVYVFHWQAKCVWLLEHVTGIATTRRQGREWSWRYAMGGFARWFAKQTLDSQPQDEWLRSSGRPVAFVTIPRNNSADRKEREEFYSWGCILEINMSKE